MHLNLIHRVIKFPARRTKSIPSHYNIFKCNLEIEISVDFICETKRKTVSLYAPYGSPVADPINIQ